MAAPSGFCDATLTFGISNPAIVPLNLTFTTSSPSTTIADPIIPPGAVTTTSLELAISTNPAYIAFQASRGSITFVSVAAPSFGVSVVVAIVRKPISFVATTVSVAYSDLSPTTETFVCVPVKKKKLGVFPLGIRDYIDVAFPKEVTPDPILNYQNQQYVNPTLITSENILMYVNPLVLIGYSNLNSLNSNVYRYFRSPSNRRDLKGLGSVDTGTHK